MLELVYPSVEIKLYPGENEIGLLHEDSDGAHGWMVERDELTGQESFSF